MSVEETQLNTIESEERDRAGKAKNLENKERKRYYTRLHQLTRTAALARAARCCTKAALRPVPDSAELLVVEPAGCVGLASPTAYAQNSARVTESG